MFRLVLARQMLWLVPKPNPSTGLLFPLLWPNQSNLSLMLITTKMTLLFPQGSCELNMRHLSCLMTWLFFLVHLWYANECSKVLPKSNQIISSPGENLWWRYGVSILNHSWVIVFRRMRLQTDRENMRAMKYVKYQIWSVLIHFFFSVWFLY